MSPGKLTAQLTPAVVADDGDADRAMRLALLAAIVESSDDAIVSKTLEGRILSWNASATRIFGYRAAEVIGKPITVIIPPELHQEEQEFLQRLRRGECIERFDTVRLAKNGRRIPISLTISPVRDSRGVIIGASKIARDISDRKRAERVQIQTEARLAAESQALAKLNAWSTRLWRSGSLAEGLDEMLAAVIELLGADRGNVQLLDERRGVLSIVAQRGFEREFLDFFREVSAAHGTACGRSLGSGERIVIEDVETDAPFEPFRAIARASGFRAVTSIPLISANGTRLGVISAHFRNVHRPAEQDLQRLDLYLRQASDFIHRCKLEQVLRQNEETLREADHRKDEFLALLAHELRNPLAPIRYALATATKDARTPEQRQRAEAVVDRQVAHMSRLLDDLLDISRITQGTLELKKERTELQSVVDTAIETARPAMDARQHTLRVDLPPHGVVLEADAVRLAQVFSNLLINAAKYTDCGGNIALRAAQHAGEIVVTVSDNGVGIAAELMPRLFTLFSQADSERARSEGGLGVGLALARELVTLHGGTIQAHSRGVGCGSEFRVCLPLGAPGTQPADSAPDVLHSAALSILVVDDNRDTADTCAMLLELSGSRVRTAYTAAAALEAGEAFHPDVMLLDIGLPDMDGYELARKMRATAWGRGAALVAVTGWGQDADRRRAVAAGFDHHLTKPLAADAMTSLLRTLEQERATVAPAAR